MGNLEDSGHRKTFVTGAQRERAKGKGRYDLIPPEALEALADIFEAGAEKYGERNWELGLPLETFIDSGFRHLVKLMAGQDDEDHAALALTNLAMFIATRKRGCVPDEVETVKLTFQVTGTDAHVQETMKGWLSDNRCGDRIDDSQRDRFGANPHAPHSYKSKDARIPNMWCDGYITPPGVAGPIRESDVDVIKRVDARLGAMRTRPVKDNPQA